MKAFSTWVIRYRWVLLIAMIAVTAVLGYATKNLKSNYDYESWLPEGDEVAELVREVDRDFSATMVLFVLLDFREQGVFKQGSLELVERITRDLEGTEGLFNVTSLLNVIDIRKIDDGVMVGELIEEIPHTPAKMQELKTYILTQPMGSV